MRKVSLVLAVLVLGSLPLMSSHAGEDKVRDLMKRKLTHAQHLLEGIALNDFEKIAKNADKLVLISKTTDWKVIRTPEYELYSNEFRRTGVAVAEAAKAKNLDGAALAYVEMTLTCVKCHKYVREVRMARLD